MIKACDVIQYARDALGGGYCWGASGEKCSPTFRQELSKRVEHGSQNYINLVGLGKNPSVCAKWDGKPVWDCSGLFRGAWRKLASYKSGGATTIFYEWLSESGSIETMPDEPGIAMFRWDGKKTNGRINMQHIGLYVGGGMVIEARGSRDGVIIGALSSYPWTHWGMLGGVDYGGAEPAAQTPSEDILCLAEVVNVKTGLNFRTSPVNTTNTILLLPPGAVVEVLQGNAGNGMCKARYLGRVGYCTQSYLSQVEPEGGVA